MRHSEAGRFFNLGNSIFTMARNKWNGFRINQTDIDITFILVSAMNIIVNEFSELFINGFKSLT